MFLGVNYCDGALDFYCCEIILIRGREVAKSLWSFAFCLFFVFFAFSSLSLVSGY